MKLNPLTLGLTVAFVGFAGYYFLFEKSRPTENPDSISIWRIEEAKAPSILSLEAGNKKVVFEKIKNTWHLQGMPDLALDTRWDSNYPGFLKPSAERKLAEDASLKDYGLDHPFLRATLRQDQETHTLLLGSKNPAGNAYYAAEAGKRTIYLVSSWQADGWKDLVDKPPVLKATPLPPKP